MKKNILFKTLVICILIVILFPSITVFGATSAEAGRYVASYAKNFCEKYNLQWIGGGGEQGYINGNTFYSHCVAFCRRMYTESIGYTPWIPVPSGNNSGGATNSDVTVGYNGSDFQLIGFNDISKARPGDILENAHHVVIFVGNEGGVNDLVANNGHDSNRGLANGLMSYTNDYSHSSTTFISHGNVLPGVNGCCYRVWRLTDEAAEKLGDVSSFSAGGDLVAEGNSSVSSTGGLGSGSGSNLGSGIQQPENMSDFYYNGIPDGKYSVTKGFLELLVDKLAAIFDWIVGLLTMASRMVFVGWTAIIENLIVLTVSSIAGGGDLETVSVTSTDVSSSDDAITVDKIVFNQMSIFDVNFFNYND